jgi:hypothetical protein
MISSRLQNLSRITPIHKLNYRYKFPGYFYHINLGEYEDDLFLEVRRYVQGCEIYVQIEWKLCEDSFLNELSKFDCQEIYTYDNDLFVRRSDGFTSEQEGLLITNLLDIASGRCVLYIKRALEQFGNKYQLK